MRVEYLVIHAIVLKLEDGDIAVGTCAGEQAAGFVRRPGERVDAGGV